MPDARRFDLICFDWDGTLFDSTSIIVRCIQQAVVDVGGARPSDEAAAYVIGLPLAPALALAAPDVPPGKYRDLGLRYRHHYLARQHDISLFEGVPAMLESLKRRHHWLAVATGKSRRGLDEVLALSRLQGAFDGTRSADETAGKPDPRMLHELMREFGADPERTLMIGDTTHDLQMALNAGCASLGVSYGAHEPREFSALGPLHVAHSVADLQRWLDEAA
ncbi:MAG: HAD-IA family hydrolase [Desulfovibrionaceae bacterium]|jgi:phosphoglycolate phosphatase|nr:HAD-IA family hydrolase [Desulfovibrionaceae bacterium]